MQTRSLQSSRIASLCGTRTRTARLYNRVFARMSAGFGYQPYGYDWPTLWSTNPGWAQLLRDVMTAHNSLPKVSA